MNVPESLSREVAIPRRELALSDRELAAYRELSVQRTIQSLADPVVLPRANPNVVLGAIAAGVLVVTWLWWGNNPRPASLGDVLISGGRITGLYAGYAVVVVLFLMARVPSIDRGVGTDRLARWHANAGRLMVLLATAHALLIIWGYAAATGAGLATQAREIVIGYPGALLATAALVIFWVVGLASARAARKRMRYETWHYLHFYMYLGIALVFSHQVQTGSEFAGRPVTQTLWGALYAIVGATILWYRFLNPMRQSFKHDLHVASVQRESADVVSIVVRGNNLLDLGAQSGQFFRWRFLAQGHWWAANPFSLSAPPTDTELRLTARAVGDHTRGLPELEMGTRVIAEGPYGAMVAAAGRNRRVLLIAAGVGITPMRALFETIKAGPGHLTLVYRVSDAGDILFPDELEAIAAARGARLFYATGKRGDASDPFVGSRLNRLVPGLRLHDVYICAAPAMTKALLETLAKLGVPKDQIHYELFEF